MAALEVLPPSPNPSQRLPDGCILPLLVAACLLSSAAAAPLAGSFATLFLDAVFAVSDTGMGVTFLRTNETQKHVCLPFLVMKQVNRCSQDFWEQVSCAILLLPDSLVRVFLGHSVKNSPDKVPYP